MSFFMRRRGELSILLHPLTDHPIQDHTGRAMWMGTPYKIDLTCLSEYSPGPDGEDAPQYPELELGYSAPTSH